MPANTLHLITQRGQPYGSQRRCCEQCGVAYVLGPMKNNDSWTDDPDVYESPPDDYVPCRAAPP